jgi:hypothetical protein
MENKIINKYWGPIIEVTSFVEKFCKFNIFSNILEIGPGIIQFPLATKFIGCNEKIENYINIDIDVDKLPFEDKVFDFVYSRHTLEDIQNPDFVMREIIRVSNSGYIETPSPMVEITKGVDYSKLSSNYTGYVHHRYIVWSDIEKCEIHFLPKYSIIIENLIQFSDIFNKDIINTLNTNPLHWNNYFIWKNNTPKIIMHKIVVNIDPYNLVEEYSKLLEDAVNTCFKNNEYFYNNFIIK